MNKVRLFFFLLTVSAVLSFQASAQSVAGYDVFLLAGQSNMEGFGAGADSSADATVNPRIWQWNNTTNTITPAVDPFYTWQGQQGSVGPGLTFAKAYLSSLPANRQVLLVNAAAGGTGFWNGFWQEPSGSGAATALQYANAAMAAAGPGARFAGIIWHQGEADILNNGAANYETNFLALMSFFKSNITGASSSTPIVVGEMVPAWLASNLSNTSVAPLQYTILNDFHALPDTVPDTAWTSSELLPGDLVYTNIHFCKLSQRAFGRRYYERFLQASNGLPQPEMSLKSWAGAFYDDGRGLLSLSALPTNNPPTVNGTVYPVVDPIRGNVAQISQGGGYLSYVLPATAFNGSYTKMAWFRVGASGYANPLIAGSNPGQTHFLEAQTLSGGSVSISAGHSSGAGAANISATVPAAAGSWMQIALVYNATAQTMALYVNGAQVATQSSVAPAPASTSNSATLPVLMGSLSGGSSAGLDGEMAGNRVWTSALTATQITTVYSLEVLSTPNALLFGPVAPVSPATQSYVYTPSSGATVSSVSVLTEGLFGGDYSLAKTSTCAAGAAASCTVNVTLTPSFAGLRRGALVITDSSGAQTSVFLSGSGVLTPSYQQAVTSVLLSGLSTPSGVAVDGGGNVYIANSGAGTVTEVNAAGSVVRTIGGFASPSGVALDGAGNLYVSEAGLADVQKVPMGGSSFSPVAFGFSTSNSPQGMATDAAGNVYVADPGDNFVDVIAASGQVHTVATGALTLSAPNGVAVDAVGNIYIADTGNSRIVEVPVTGAANTSVYATGFAAPTSVTFDGVGNLFVTDSATGTLYEMAAGSTTPVSIAIGFSSENSVAVGANGTVYVADSGNGRIVQLQRTNTTLSPQTVTFGAIAAQTVGSTLTLSASASSGLQVSFASTTTGVCTVSGTTLSLLNIGTCTVRAVQTGNALYAAAATVSQSFGVTGTALMPPVNVSLASVFNVDAIVSNGSSPANGGLDGSGYAFSASLLGSSIAWSGVTFSFGAPNTANGASIITVPLPAGNYSSMKLLATGSGVSQPQTFVVTYTDGTTATLTQSISNWGAPQYNSGESIALTMPYRITPTGTSQNALWYLYGYSFPLNSGKTVASVTLPASRAVVTLAIALVPASTTTALNLSSVNNVYAIANDGKPNSGTGNDGYSYSANLLGTSLNFAGQTYVLGNANAPSAVTSKTISLSAGNFTTLSFLASGIYGIQPSQVFTVTYTDGTTTKFTQGVSEWGGAPQNYAGESIASTTAYRVTPNGTTQNGPWYIFGYTLALNPSKTVQSLALPNNTHLLVFAIDLAATPSSLQSQAITFGSIAGQNVGATLTLNATASSGLAVTYTSTTTPVCTVSGSTLSLIGPGTCTIAASQAGNASYAAAVSVSQSFLVSSLSQQPVGLSGVANVYAISNFSSSPINGGLDGAGYAYAQSLIGSSVTWGGVTFSIGQAGVADAVTSTSIPLPSGQFSTVKILATAAFGNQINQQFILTYSDGTTSTYTQSVSDWGSPQSFTGESIALGMANRVTPSGTAQAVVTWNLYGYSIPVSSGKTVVSLTLPNSHSVVVLAVTAAS